MKKIILPILLFIFVSCSAKMETTLYYYEDTNFQVSKINSVETFIKSISSSWDFRFFEKDRKSMKALTQDSDAFFIGLYKGGKHILTITNVGVGSTLRVSIYGDNDLPKELLKTLSEEVAQGLSALDIQLEKQTKEHLIN